MRKVVFLLLFALFWGVCFSACLHNEKEDHSDISTLDSVEDSTDQADNSTFDSTEDGAEDEKIKSELNRLFAELQRDSDKLEKIVFFIEYQELHYQLKEDGKYNGERWTEPSIIVTVDCNYDLATDEEWYIACLHKDIKTLNTAFFKEYSHELSEGHFTAWGIAPTLFFEYVHSASTLSETLSIFCSDYAVMKQWIDLEYVNNISIGYYYSIPGSYFDE